jgi:hypothetical protein
LLSVKQISLITIAIGLAVFTYWSGLSEAVLRWGTQEEYSHGYLIPLVTLYILWEKKDLIRSAVTEPLWLGVVLVLIVILVLIIGEISALFLLIQYSFVVVGLIVSDDRRSNKIYCSANIIITFCYSVTLCH